MTQPDEAQETRPQKAERLLTVANIYLAAGAPRTAADRLRRAADELDAHADEVDAELGIEEGQPACN